MKAIQRLLDIMVRLRDPEEGCPWDREQDFASIAPYTIEEAYEVDDAIRRGDMDDLRGELGDLLLQVVYHAQMAAEAGLFDFEAVAAGIGEKLVRRHPHVFEGSGETSSEQVLESWEASKARERSDRARARGGEGDLFGGIPATLPALMRAVKLQRRGAGHPEGESMESARAEFARSVEALPADPGPGASDQVGDALFALAALARRMQIDPEGALRDANARFEARVRSQALGPEI
ncbi:MAG: nucleoside triphosphate pyrophosphohydrolase [Myxococcota bacterium]|nr:nucleoside triphosphate pyrophosphohydrolase [Myxococcota bacterium]